MSKEITKDDIVKILDVLELQGTIKSLSGDGGVWNEGIDLATHIANGGEIKKIYEDENGKRIWPPRMEKV